MTTYAPEFVRITNTLTGTSAALTNITSWQEDEYNWKGVERDAFDGTILSTLRAPRRMIKLTREFNSGAELDAFQEMVGAGVDPTTGAIVSLAKCLASSSYAEGGLRTSDVAFPCYVHITRKVPWFREEAGAMKTGWIADIELRGTV